MTDTKDSKKREQTNANVQIKSITLMSLLSPGQNRTSYNNRIHLSNDFSFKRQKSKKQNLSPKQAANLIPSTPTPNIDLSI